MISDIDTYTILTVLRRRPFSLSSERDFSGNLVKTSTMMLANF
jgi:hypothetical protein